ncbi:MAG: hypothetical protein JJ895_10745 [Balneolaceae bacterium]|nr:hypothetical protein [Balneolaceae bacterium]
MAESENLDALLVEAEQQAAQFGDDSAEVIQHLRDLGYLNQLPFGAHNREVTLNAALSKFEAELLASEIFNKDEIQSLRALYTNAFAEEMLRKFMDLDEGIPINEMPQTGEINLSSRLIHYRLGMYGLYALNAGHAFGFTTMMGLQTLKHHLSISSNLDAVNQLANKEGVLKRILSIYGNERCLMFVHVNANEMKQLHFEPKKVRSARDFYHRLSEDFELKPKYLAGFKRDILSRHQKDVKWEYVKGRSTDELTNFIIKVLQVHQWMDGFYDGKTDGEIGSMSLNSIADLLKFYNAGNDADLPLKSMLYYIGKGYFVFNALTMINNYVIEDAPDSRDEDVIKSLTIQSGRLTESDRAKFEANLNAVLDSAKVELHQQKQKAKMGIGKRVYFGIRSFLKKLFRIGKRLVKMILHHLKKIFKQLSDFFKRVLEYGKQALKSFIQGIKYIIGRLPIITENEHKLAITHAEFMGDTFSILSDPFSKQGYDKHHEKVLEVQRSAQFSVALVGEVLKLLKYMLKGFVGWPILILQLAKATRTLYQKHQLIYQH